MITQKPSPQPSRRFEQEMAIPDMELSMFEEDLVTVIGISQVNL